MFPQEATRRSVPTFTHYSRKGYSVFASLKREVRIGVLGVALISGVQMMKAEMQQPQRQLRRTDDTEQTSDETAPQSGTLMQLPEQPQAVSAQVTQSVAGAAIRPRPGIVHHADQPPRPPLLLPFTLRQHRIYLGWHEHDISFSHDQMQRNHKTAEEKLHPQPIDWAMHHLIHSYHPATHHSGTPHTSPPKHP